MTSYLLPIRRLPRSRAGRWPHIHFEVYPSLDKATSQANKIATSQIALPADWCNRVYATSGYEQSVTNLKGVTLATDNVFRDDGGVDELGTVSGDLSSGLSVLLAVPVRLSWSGAWGSGRRSAVGFQQPFTVCDASLPWVFDQNSTVITSLLVISSFLV